jgi:hypothetical protein
MRSRLLAVLAAAGLAALLAGCAESPYYGGTYSYGYSDYYPGYDYGPGYYSYYDYGPGYYYSPGYYYGPGFGLSYSYRSGDGDRHWNGSSWSSRSAQGSGAVQTQPRSTNRIATQPRIRSANPTVAHGDRHLQTRPRAARQPSHVASQTRTGPDREHGGGG